MNAEAINHLDAQFGTHLTKKATRVVENARLFSAGEVTQCGNKHGRTRNQPGMIPARIRPIDGNMGHGFWLHLPHVSLWLDFYQTFLAFAVPTIPEECPDESILDSDR